MCSNLNTLGSEVSCNPGTVPEFTKMDRRKPCKPSVMILGFLAEIKTMDFLNITCSVKIPLLFGMQ
jgi:hypothetical protein